MRVRITFSKQGALRYIGHLDLHKLLERSIRRARLPLAYSQGYHPQPKLNLAAALPLGFSSRAEVMDIWLKEEVEDVVSALQANVPPGLTILSAAQVDEREPSLQTQVIAAEYQVEITEAPQSGEAGSARRPELARPGRVERSRVEGSRLNERIASVMEAESIPRERRRKQYDLRPLIEELSLTPDPSPTGRGEILIMRLTAREGATGRPEEVLDELGIPIEDARIERTALIFKDKQKKSALSA
jgi:radical SAM-linked protein